ncbi:MAG TPA: FUSC family protein [Mycobacteriales bacterium]
MGRREVDIGQVMRARLARVRRSWLLILQSAVATSLSWGLATTFFQDAPAVFAPVTALVTVAVSLSQHLRRSAELVLGVALGLLVSDLLVQVTGTGVWQLALIVALAMVAAIMLGGSTTVTVQAGATGIIIATVVPVRNLLFDRLYDALIGGAVGLLVAVLLLPANPVTVARRTAAPMLNELAEALRELSTALRTGAHSSVRAAAETVRAVEKPLGEFADAAEGAAETVRLAPYRWREKGRITPYVRLADRMGPVIRNLRVLTRRSRAILSQGEPAPPGIPDALEGVAHAVELLLDDLLADRDPERARAELLRACRMTADIPEGMSISGQVIVGQLRSAAVDLLRACGLGQAEAAGAVRRIVTAPRIRLGPTL